MNDPNKPGDGVVKVLEGDTARDFATGMNEPKGICFTGKYLVVTDVKPGVEDRRKGTATILADDAAFSEPVVFLNDAACQPGGKVVYVTDMGANTRMRDPQGNLWPLDSPGAEALPAIGRVYRISLDGKVQIAVDKVDRHALSQRGVGGRPRPAADRRVLQGHAARGARQEATPHRQRHARPPDAHRVPMATATSTSPAGPRARCSRWARARRSRRWWPRAIPASRQTDWSSWTQKGHPDSLLPAYMKAGNPVGLLLCPLPK
jgi:hypothetical protein